MSTINRSLSTKICFYLSIIQSIIIWLICCIPLTFYLIVTSLIPKFPKHIAGKVVLITGGGNGLGRAIAMRFGQEGCNIAIADLDKKAAKSVARELESKFLLRSIGYYVDVTNYESIINLREQIKKDFGYVTILVNNAGVITFLSLREKELSDIDHVFKVNLYSHLWTSRIFIRDMITKRDGHIVAISSIAGILPLPWGILYSTTQFGIRGFMKSLADEFYMDGHGFIKTTTAFPYIVNTNRAIEENLNPRILPITSQDAAGTIVSAVLRNKEMVIVPEYMTGPVRILELIPTSIRRLFYRIVFRYHQIRTINYKI